MNVVPYSPAGSLQAAANFRASIAVEGVTTYPGDNVNFQTYGEATDNSASAMPVPGFVTYLPKSFGTSNQALQATYWHNIGHEEDEPDFQIPYVCGSDLLLQELLLEGSRRTRS